MVNPLPNRKSPFKGEGLYSLLYRNAIKNWFPHLGSMLRDEIGNLVYLSNLNYYDDNQEWVSLIKKFLNEEVLFEEIDTLVLNQYDNDLFQKKSNSFEQNIFYNKNYASFCPLCLQENFYYRLFWDFSFLTVCTKHKIFLINKCNECGKKIYLSRLFREECTCGANFIKNSSITEVDSKFVRNQEVIYDFLLGKSNLIELEQYGTNLTKFEYFQLFYLFGMLIDGLPIEGEYSYGTSIIANFTRLRDERNVQRDIAHLGDLANKIHQLITNPEEELPKILQVIDNQILSQSKKVYRRKYDVLKEIVQTIKGDFYHKVYSKYLCDLKDENVNRRKAITPCLEKKKYLTFNEVLTKTKVNSLFNLDKFNLINVITTTKNGKEVRLVEADSLTKYIETKRNTFNIAQIVNITGLTIKNVIELTECGFFKVIHKSEEVNKIWYIQKNEVNQLMDSMFKDVKILEELNDGFIPFKFVLRSAFSLGGDLEFLIRYLINNLNIYKWIHGRKGFKGLYISSEHLEIIQTYLKKERIKYFGFNFREVQKELKLGGPKLEIMIENGTLPVSRKEKLWAGQKVRFFSEEIVRTLALELK